jgi:phosphoesterase RecJ-like protein
VTPSSTPPPPADTWSSNATLAEIADRLAGAKRIAILTHAKPDGDAVGSSIALTRALAHRGIPATPVFLGPWAARFDPLIPPTRVIHEHHNCFADPALTSADTVVIVDTGSWNQVADARAYIEPRHASAIVIDHHSHGDPAIAAMRHIDPTAAAAVELICAVAKRLLGIDSPAKLPKDVAEPLYLGLATDTGWFKYPNTTSHTLRLAADLMDAGVDADRIFQISEQGDTVSRLYLIERALASLQILDGGRGAIMCLTKSDFDATGASEDEYGGIIDLPKAIGSVRVIALLTEVEPALTKVSFRSKAAFNGSEEVDVNILAQRFGGGGHKHAAGAKIRLPLAEAADAVAAAIAAS